MEWSPSASQLFGAKGSQGFNDSVVNPQCMEQESFSLTKRTNEEKQFGFSKISHPKSQKH